MRCFNCATEGAGGRFCTNCGSSLLNPTTTQSVRAERRHLTVLFCDLVDSTSLSERLDPEDLREVVQTYQSVCATVVRRYEGHIAQYLGDGLLVYFGFPVAHEDDAQRAGRAGLEIAEAVGMVHGAGQPLQVRVGIHSGLVVVGEIGEGSRREQLALGETPNLAARVQMQAEPGWVVMSEATERLVRGFFKVDETAGETSLKRPQRRFRLFRIRGVTEAISRFDAASKEGLAPCLGRTEEVDSLSDLWAHACNGASRSILIRGEPGIGKSRLVKVVKEWLDPHLHNLLECRCSPYYKNSALHPIIEMLERRFGFDRGQTPGEKQGILQNRVVALGLDPDKAVPLLAPLFSIAIGDQYPPASGAPAQQRQKTLEMLADGLIRLGMQHPTVFILEDLHWADPTTLEVMRLVLNRLAGSTHAHLMVLLTARLEFPVGYLDCLPEINLRPLAREDSKRLVAHVTGQKALPDDVLTQLLARAGGIPLFVEEVTKAILEGGAFRELADRYELEGDLPTGVVPASIQDSLMARIDRLGESKPLAQLAATLGREFRHEVLQAVSSLDESALARDIAQLVESQLVYQTGTPPRAVYTFKHALIQDAAYDSLLRKTRQQYHEKIALTLAERFPDLQETEPELLARHYDGAGLIPQAIDSWQKAGERAMSRAANLEAIPHLGRAITLVNTQPPTPARLQRELAIHLALGPALMAIKGYSAPEVRQAYTRARAICRELGDVPQAYSALWGLWAYYFVGGDLGQAIDLGEEVYHLAKTSNNTKLLASASHAYCYPMLYRGGYRKALELAEAALDGFDLEREVEMVREFQFSSATALYDIAGTALWVLGYPDRALKMAERATALAAELNHSPSMAYAACSLSWGVPHLRREPAKVRRAAETVFTLSNAEEFSFWPPLARVFLGWAYIADGNVEMGIAETQNAMKQYRAVGGGNLRTTAFAIIADGYRRLGRFAEGLRIVEEGFADVVTTQESHYEQELYRLKGELLAGLGRLDEGEGFMRHAVELTRQQEARSLELRATMSLARLWRKRNRSTEAYGLLAETYGWFVEGFETADLCEAKALLAELSAVR